MALPPAILTRPDGSTIAYARLEGKAPGVLFLSGFHSDMTGIKATRLEAHCRRRGQAYLRFDYLGHGQSSGRFEDGGIGRWAEDAIACIDHLTDGAQVLVGSSMGGWLMLLAALARPERVDGLLGIAAAPDFTEELLWPSLPEAAREAIEADGVWQRPSAYGPDPYPITKGLIEEGRRHLLLGRTLPLACPVRLIHGMADADVPYVYSLWLADALAASDVVVSLVKDGEHRLSREADIERICGTLDELLDR
ncbi:MAG: alpha/beta hydrolase [Proteobacteria bacterium]|nr:alpha/beta hydrolase [Pseudomonadota bacterium]MBI3497657.1 alpha/beta hydrolase [Pseudomonadota bacterium]